MIARRDVFMKDSESTDILLKRIGFDGTIVTTDNRGDYVVITPSMDDDAWESLKLWASENGLLAN